MLFKQRFADHVIDNSEIEKPNALIVRSVNECEAAKFNTTSLTMQNPENKSGISTDHQDTHGEKKVRMNSLETIFIGRFTMFDQIRFLLYIITFYNGFSLLLLIQ